MSTVIGGIAVTDTRVPALCTFELQLSLDNTKLPLKTISANDARCYKNCWKFCNYTIFFM
jgi:hypothetical protein